MTLGLAYLPGKLVAQQQEVPNVPGVEHVSFRLERASSNERIICGASYDPEGSRFTNGRKVIGNIERHETEPLLDHFQQCHGLLSARPMFARQAGYGCVYFGDARGWQTADSTFARENR